jgi:hypothetical protein
MISLREVHQMLGSTRAVLFDNTPCLITRHKLVWRSDNVFLTVHLPDGRDLRYVEGLNSMASYDVQESVLQLKRNGVLHCLTLLGALSS